MQLVMPRAPVAAEGGWHYRRGFGWVMYPEFARNIASCVLRCFRHVPASGCARQALRAGRLRNLAR